MGAVADVAVADAVVPFAVTETGTIPPAAAPARLPVGGTTVSEVSVIDVGVTPASPNWTDVAPVKPLPAMVMAAVGDSGP